MFKNFLKNFFGNLSVNFVNFIFSDNETYEPLGKCRKAWWVSIAGFVFTAFLLIYFLIIKSSITGTILTIHVLCLLTIGFATVSGIKIENEIRKGNLKQAVITVISAKKINFSKKIEAVTDDEKNMEFIMESDIRLKKDRRYKIYYLIKDDRYVITHAKQISA